MKKAFTLAEMLIALLIIGIIAAMTIPTLYHKIQRRTVEVKLERFDSIMNQAIKLAIKDNGGIYFNPPAGNNGEYLKQWFDTYLLKYLKVDYSDKQGIYYKFIMQDGSGFWTYVYGGGFYFFYCLKANDKSCHPNCFDGKNSFLFVYDKNTNLISPYGANITETQRLKFSPISKNGRGEGGCYITNSESRHFCAQLIKQNGWKIPDDYPWL